MSAPAKTGSCRSRMSFQELLAFFASDLLLDFALRPYRSKDRSDWDAR
jgi:hypothetical protein